MKLFILSSIIGFLGCSMYVEPAPAHAEVYVERPAVTTTLYVSSAPPAPRVEYYPAPRAGYIWVDGYWHWSGRTWVWYQGHWEAERVGYVWVAPRYETHHGKSVYYKGSWAPAKGYKASGKASTGYKASNGKNANGYKASNKQVKGYKTDSNKNDKKKSKRSDRS